MKVELTSLQIQLVTDALSFYREAVENTACIAMCDEELLKKYNKTKAECTFLLEKLQKLVEKEDDKP